MHHTHNLFCRFAGGLFFFLTLCLAPSLAQIVFDTSPGTSAPPNTLGPYTMTPFAPDNTADGTPVMMAMTGGICGANASVMFNPMLGVRKVPTTWTTWSHGYTGTVYRNINNPTTVTLTLPAGTAAFYFYAEPNNFGSFMVQATANDGTTTGQIPVIGNAGARYIGFYTTGPAALTTITISVAPEAGGFAIGEFGISCQPVQAITNPSSDQKAGSFLVFPYYTSKAVDNRDTRITISNINSTTRTTTAVHLFFIDGNTCYQQDMFLCLTPNASVSFKTSEYDPEVTGFIYAVAVHPTNGVPIKENVLIGNAFVRDGEYIGNYGAESFWSYGQTRDGADLTPFNSTATLTFGAAYDGAPTEFGVEIQSPLDKAGQKLVLAPLAGDLTYVTADSENSLYTAAAQVGAGLAYNEQENMVSFSALSPLLAGTCLRTAIITTTHPRVPNTLGNLIRSGKAGWLRFKVTAAVGLLMTPRNSNNTWTGIRNLHKTATGKATLQIGIFPPVC